MIVKDLTMIEDLMSISSGTTSPAPSSAVTDEKVQEEAAKLSEEKAKSVKGESSHYSNAVVFNFKLCKPFVSECHYTLEEEAPKKKRKNMIKVGYC